MTVRTRGSTGESLDLLLLCPTRDLGSACWWDSVAHHLGELGEELALTDIAGLAAQVTTDAPHFATLVSYRKDRLTARCPNHPLFALIPSHLPRTHCTPGKRCYCGATFSIDRADLPNSFEPRLWGTTRCARDYFRRNLVETHNAYAQAHPGEGKTTYRVQAPKWDLFRMMKAIGITMLNIHTWMCRLGVAHAHTHTPEITKAAIAPHLEPPDADPVPSQRSGRPPDRPPEGAAS